MASVKPPSRRWVWQQPTLETAFGEAARWCHSLCWFQLAFALSGLFQEERESFFQQPIPYWASVYLYSVPFSLKNKDKDWFLNDKYWCLCWNTEDLYKWMDYRPNAVSEPGKDTGLANDHGGLSSSFIGQGSDTICSHNFQVIPCLWIFLVIPLVFCGFFFCAILF